MSRYETGTVIDFVGMNAPIKGSVISEPVTDNIYVYSLAENTELNPQTFRYPHVVFIHSGKILAFDKDHKGVRTTWQAQAGDLTITPTNIPIGCTAIEDGVYTRFEVIKPEDINASLKPRGVYSCKDLVPYEEGKVNCFDVVRNEALSIKLLALDRNCTHEEMPDAGKEMIHVIDGSVTLHTDNNDIVIDTGRSFLLAKHHAGTFHTNDSPCRMILTMNGI